MTLSSIHRRSPRRGLVAAAAATSLALLGGAWVGTALADSADPADPAAPGSDPVAAVHYTLGDTAFQVPGFHSGDPDETDLADIELTGIVHYPRDLAGGPHPLVLMAHGLADTCADRNAPQRPRPTPPTGTTGATAQTTAKDPLAQWPCAEGTPILPSYRGYDYLGENLASHGFVVVSISANGINVGESGVPQDMARAALMNKHLAMWQQLTGTGGGPLAGRFTDATSGARRAVDFTGRVDLTRVGTLGHSRGGRGVMYQAAEKHRADWPAGVQVRAALPLAPAGIALPDDPDMVADYQLTSVPFLDWEGTCDYGAQGDFFPVTAGKNQATSRELRVHGANHNFLNVQWSPSSGQVSSYDDADFGPRPGPGKCTSRDDDSAVRQLTEPEERRVATGYVSAYFRRYLTGDSGMDPILNGEKQPYAQLTRVEAQVSKR